MSSLSRKDFLRLSVWGALATLLPVQEIQSLSFILNTPRVPTADDYAAAVKLAETAKIHFFKKEYDKAEELYKKCIALAPKAIRFYDNLDNVYGAKGQFLKSVELYKNGLKVNENNVAFYDRAARALMRIELGYKKLADTYKAEISSNSLLNDALKLYDEALSIDSKKVYLYVGKKKIEDKLAINALAIDFRKDSAYKSVKKQRALLVKQQFNALPIAELEKQLDTIDKKKRNTLFFYNEVKTRDKNILGKKKKLLRLITDKHIADSNKSEAISNVKKLADLDISDSGSIKKLQSVFYKNSLYFEFIEYKKRYAEKEENVFGYLGLMEAIQVAYQKNSADYKTFKDAQAIAEDLLNNWSLSEILAIDVIDKYNKLLVLDNNISKAKTITEFLFTKLVKVPNASANKIIHSYASLFFAENNYQAAKDILLTGLGQNGNETNFESVQQLVAKKQDETFKSKIHLYYLLYETHKKLNEFENAAGVLNILETNNPQDQFVLKRK